MSEDNVLNKLEYWLDRFNISEYKNAHLKAWMRTSVLIKGSSGRTRTYNLAVNSRPLCRLSYRGTRVDYNRPESEASSRRSLKWV